MCASMSFHRRAVAGERRHKVNKLLPVAELERLDLAAVSFMARVAPQRWARGIERWVARAAKLSSFLVAFALVTAWLGIFAMVSSLAYLFGGFRHQ